MLAKSMAWNRKIIRHVNLVNLNLSRHGSVMNFTMWCVMGPTINWLHKSLVFCCSSIQMCRVMKKGWSVRWSLDRYNYEVIKFTMVGRLSGPHAKLIWKCHKGLTRTTWMPCGSAMMTWPYVVLTWQWNVG